MKNYIVTIIALVSIAQSSYGMLHRQGLAPHVQKSLGMPIRQYHSYKQADSKNSSRLKAFVYGLGGGIVISGSMIAIGSSKKTYKYVTEKLIENIVSSEQNK
ncbi:MAG: hypothetical protein CL947_01040 [Epsilonproteobacteria bacterium]|nr:hypothetical protein [Campylobacterota bacterium]|tara:strand:+ start:696 stop:1001 length:306 start_codon:yes stop_codon:yes gene_type:complete